VKSHGEVISTIDVYDGGFILLAGPDNADWLKAADRVRAELKVPLGTFVLGSDLLPVDETTADLLQRYGLESSGALLIRPDGFVGFRSAGRVDDEYQALGIALRQILDLARAERGLHLSAASES
jgi:hypothetical protein